MTDRSDHDVPAHDDAGEDQGFATRATRGMLWTSLSSLVARGLGFAVTMVLTYWVAQDDYGQANAAQTLAFTLGFFAVPGFPSFLVRTRARFADSASLASWTCTALWVLLALPVLVFADPIARAFDTNAFYLRVALLIPSVVIPLLLPEVILNRQLRFGVQSVLDLGGSTASAGTTIGLAAAGTGGLAVIFGPLVRALLVHFISLAVTGLSWLRRPQLDWPLLKEMLLFGVPIYFSNMLEFAAQNWDNLFVARTFGAKALGPYAVAYTLAYTPIYTVTQRVSSVVLATVARFSDDEERRRQAILRALGAVMMLLTAAAVLTMICGPRVVRLLISDDWAETVAVLVVSLSLVGVGLPLQFLPDYYFQAIGRPRATVWVMAFKVGLMFAALYTFGRATVEAAAWSVSGAFVVAGLIACSLLRPIDAIPLPQVLRALLPGAVGALVMSGSILGFRQWYPLESDLLALIVEVCLGSAAYLLYQLLFHRARVADVLSSLRG